MIWPQQEVYCEQKFSQVTNFIRRQPSQTLSGPNSKTSVHAEAAKQEICNHVFQCIDIKPLDCHKDNPGEKTGVR